jgi:hypothetical protein
MPLTIGGVRAPERDDVRVAAIVALVLTVVLAATAWSRPPSSGELAHADPLVVWFRGLGGVWAIVALSGAVALAWIVGERPSRAAVRRGVGLALAGGAAALALALAIRALVGPALPDFIPAEESARPGLTQGLAAGLVEEAVFRLALLPLAFGVAKRRMSNAAAATLAIAISALAFALAHELGPGAAPFRADYFVVRLLVPGALMSAAFFVPGPAFIVSAHGTAHLLIPLLFQ